MRTVSQQNVSTGEFARMIIDCPDGGTYSTYTLPAGVVHGDSKLNMGSAQNEALVLLPAAWRNN
jgi:hypothetical protein